MQTLITNAVIATLDDRPASLAGDDPYGLIERGYLVIESSQIAALGPLREGELVANTGFSNMRPRISRDGTRLAYLSTQKQHYGPHLLVVRDIESGDEEMSLEIDGKPWIRVK